MEMKHQQTSSSIHYYISKNDISKSNEVILFIHPAFANHRAFDEQINFFSDNYRIITVDLLGHGLSQNLKTKEKIHDTYKHINEILMNESIKKVHLVGVSLGALLAQDFANNYPHKVASLCSLGGYDINNYDASIEKEQAKEQINFMLKALFSIKSFSKSNAKITACTKPAQEKFYQMNLQFKRRSFLYMTSLGKIMNQSQSLHKFPILIMYGEHDNNLSITLSKNWSSTQPGSKLVCINNSGHCANMDNPIKFNQVVMDFIGSILSLD